MVVLFVTPGVLDACCIASVWVYLIFERLDEISVTMRKADLAKNEAYVLHGGNN